MTKVVSVRLTMRTALLSHEASYPQRLRLAANWEAKMGCERTDAYWRDLVRRFNRRGVGVTLVDFRLEHRVSSAQLYMYRKRFREEADDAPASLVPVQIVDVGTDGWKNGDGTVEVAVGGNLLLRFQVGASDATDVSRSTASPRTLSRFLSCAHQIVTGPKRHTKALHCRPDTAAPHFHNYRQAQFWQISATLITLSIHALNPQNIAPDPGLLIRHNRTMHQGKKVEHLSVTQAYVAAPPVHSPRLANQEPFRRTAGS